VATGGTEEPFSVSSGLHEFEITILDAVGAADSTVTIAPDSSHFEDESVAVFVDGKAAVVDCGRLGSERFGADRAAGKVCVHHYFPAPPEGKRKNQYSVKALICMFLGEQKSLFFYCRSGPSKHFAMAASQ
jgi:hypothetical protein